MINLIDCVQRRRTRVAGDAGVSVSFDHATNCSSPCELRSRKGFRVCARGWGGGRGQREGAECQCHARIE
jgi:hypothetical protein